MLVVATFGAFFLASRLKAEPPVLQDMRRLPAFSPDGDGVRDVQRITFRVDLRDEALVDIVDADGARVRRLGEVRIRPEASTRVRWDGRDDDGDVAPDGRYSMRLILRDDGRSILAGRTFDLDTEAPSPAVIVDEEAPIVEPGAPVPFRVRGVGPARAPSFRVVRTDVTPQRIVREFEGEAGVRSYEWDARTSAGEPARPGTYLIAVQSRDQAGNLGSGPPLPAQPGRVEGRPGVTIRALAVQPPVRAVRAGGLAVFRVDARGELYEWSVRRLGASEPVAKSRRPRRGTTLVMRVPDEPSGVYLLEARSRGRRVSVPFGLQSDEPSKRGTPLVVLPTVTWLGTSPLDDPDEQDGLPDTFAAGSEVTYPRLFAFAGGLPPGFADAIAPLLVWMDRNNRRFDVTTDLALTLAQEPLSFEDRRGVVLAGSPRWVSRGLARRLRQFAAEGGRVAVFAPGALRAGVTVGDERLTRPTPPTPVDAFGARVGDVRRLPAGADGAPAPLTVLRDDPELGLLEGFAGELRGFETVEELLEPGPRGEVVTSVGQPLSEEEILRAEEEGEVPRAERPALAAVRFGEGEIFRIGLPGWVPRLVEGDPTVEQLTHNLVDLLRGGEPKARTAG